MPYEIYPKQTIANIIGKQKVTVENITISNGCLEIGSYIVPLNNIIYIKNLG